MRYGWVKLASLHKIILLLDHLFVLTVLREGEYIYLKMNWHNLEYRKKIFSLEGLQMDGDSSWRSKSQGQDSTSIKQKKEHHDLMKLVVGR